jgi:hypothetical protein
MPFLTFELCSMDNWTQSADSACTAGWTVLSWENGGSERKTVSLLHLSSPCGLSFKGPTQSFGKRVSQLWTSKFHPMLLIKMLLILCGLISSGLTVFLSLDTYRNIMCFIKDNLWDVIQTPMLNSEAINWT